MQIKVNYSKDKTRLVNIPKYFLSFHQYNYRTVVGITPVFSPLDEYLIVGMNIIEIQKKSIIRTSLNVDEFSLQQITNKLGKTGLCEEDRLKCKVVNYLINHFADNTLSKNDFKQILDNHFSSLKNFLS